MIRGTARPVPILFTIPNFITAGSGRAMLNIIERLDRNLFAPVVCVARKGGELDRVVENMRIPFIEAPFTVPAKPYVTLPWRAWRASRAFARVQRSEDRGQRTEDGGQRSRFVLWHSFNYSDDYTEAIISRFAGAKVWVYTKKNMGWGSRAWKLRSHMASGIAVQNTAMTEQFFPNQSAKVRHIPPGVDFGLFHPGPPDPDLRQSWGFSPDTTIIGHVAQLVPIKNHAHLLRALARVKSDRVALLFAGAELDRDYAAEVRQLALGLGVLDRVRFCGRVSDVATFLRTVDVFAFCSHKEACPVAVLEAMGCGLPSVVTGIPAMRDIHFPNTTGLVVPPEDVDAFAAAIGTIVNAPSLRRQFGEAARKRVETAFTLSSEASRYQDFYSDILGGQAPLRSSSNSSAKTREVVWSAGTARPHA